MMDFNGQIILWQKRTLISKPPALPENTWCILGSLCLKISLNCVRKKWLDNNAWHLRTPVMSETELQLPFASLLKALNVIPNYIHKDLLLYHTLYLPFGKKSTPRKCLKQTKTSPSTLVPQYTTDSRCLLLLVSSFILASRGGGEAEHFAQKILTND